MKIDEIKKALATLQDLKGDPEYLINKARETKARKILAAWGKPKKKALEYKLSKHGILIAKKAIDNYFDKENIQIEESMANGNKSYTATAWLGHGEYLEFDISKKKAVPATLVFKNLKLGNVR